ncbi:ABC transporter G family member 11 [Acorus calamus]|uniref:ABC transporter G family member 11 n=1 Tax=Acorus calamus TaxID=4465 RepID=A0AAV9CYW1_ACOCL|nr:ABC transporter G family member 11 [Acorus calamus]
MGPSGCGKSTLLDALAGRLASNTRKSGEVLINGRKQKLAFGTSAYVTQDDILMTTLTVREAVYYSAHLQLPDTMTSAEKRFRAETTIKEMGLQDALNTRIGGWAVKGLSGGQKRRVSICMEILTRPKLLFLDEPTSGLDSAASYHVMSRIVGLAKHDGRTVVASIHQPSSEVFELFHNLCLLSYGKTVYFGPRSFTSESRGAMLMFIAAFLTFMAIGGFPSFVEDMKIFQRERLNGHYGVTSFVIGNTLSTTPYLALISIIPGAMAYYLVGLQKSFDHFVYFVLVLFTCMMLVESLMMIVASVVPDFLMGIITGAGIQGVMMLNWASFACLTISQGRSGGTPCSMWPSKGEEILRDVWQVNLSYSKWVDLAVLLGMVVLYRSLFLFTVKIKENFKSIVGAYLRHN